MQLQIEVKGQRRIVDTPGFKIYGTKEELEEIRRSVDIAINSGLVIGWVGIGTVDDPKTVFPFNGKPDVETKGWKD